MTSSKEFTYGLFEIAENFFLIFCTHDKLWWITK